MGEYGSGATVVNIQLTWVVADGRPENSLQMGSPTSTHRARRPQGPDHTHMQTNCKTLSSRSTKPAFTKDRVTATPKIGMMIILTSAREAIAPRGKASPVFKRKRASALPKHTRPIGTLAAPTNVAKSRTNASGGWPSGATGRKRGWKFADGSRNRALSGSTSAMTIARTITIGGGLRSSTKKRFRWDRDWCNEPWLEDPCVKPRRSM